jgi:hypothetical protein
VANWVDSKTIGGVSELVLFTPIRQGTIPGEQRCYEQRLTDELRDLSVRVKAGRPNPIMRIPTIHFARWLIIVPGQYLYQDMGGKVKDYPYHSWLLFTAYFDGDVKTYLDDFSEVLAKDVDRIWGNCEGYPAKGSSDFDAFWAYAKHYQLSTLAFYNAYPGVTVPRVHELVAFRRAFDEFVAATRGPDGTSVKGIGAEFDQFLAKSLSFPQQFPARGGVFEIEFRKS